MRRTIATTSRIWTQYAAVPRLMNPTSQRTRSIAIKNHIVEILPRLKFGPIGMIAHPGFHLKAGIPVFNLFACNI